MVSVEDNYMAYMFQIFVFLYCFTFIDKLISTSIILNNP